MAASTKPSGRFIGTSFSECTAKSGAPVFQSGFKLFHEQALAADFGQRDIQNLVALRGHAQYADLGLRI